MSQLLQQIRAAQIRAGEDAVIANLQSMGLARTERDRPAALTASQAAREQRWRYHLSDSQLLTLCNACGWQGGTYWQVVDEIRRLKAVEAKALGDTP